MSRLEELIAELCPNGVKYKTLGEIGTLSVVMDYKRKISPNLAWGASIMDKYIHIMAILFIKQNHLLLKI